MNHQPKLRANGANNSHRKHIVLYFWVQGSAGGRRGTPT